MAAIRNNLDVCVEESQMVGYLLAHLPSLRGLSLATLDKRNAHIYDPEFVSSSGLQELSGKIAGAPSFEQEITRVPTFVNLHALLLNAGNLQ